MPSPARLMVSVALACSIQATVAEAASPVPEGSQFVVVNLDYNSGGGVEMDEDGNMIVSWNLFFGGPGARGYGYDGTPAAFFTIEPHGGLMSGEPMDSAALGSNDFAFVWEGSFEGLQARRYDIDGTPLDTAIQVTAAGGAFQDIEPAIARWSPGTEMIVVWGTNNPATGDTDSFGIDARGFDASGTPLGPAFRVNGHIASHQQKPDIGVAPGNGFLIVWESDGSDGTDSDGFSIQAHRFSAAGVGGTLFQVNSFTTGGQRRPAVALAADGTALVVWEGTSEGTDPDGSIQGRIVDSTGEPLGSDFQINTTTAGEQTHPQVAPLGDCFQVVWRSTDGVFTQAVSAAGALLGSEMPVSSPSKTFYKRPTVTANASSSVVSWAEGDELGLDDVFGQRYTLALFADGFESGDTAAWSTTVP